MRGSGTFTAMAAAALLLAAWVLGSTGLPAAYVPIVRVTPELLAGVAVLLAWRFGRSRLAVGSIVVALASWLLRGPLASVDDQTALLRAVLEVLLPLNIGVLALLADQRVNRPAPLLHVALVLVQPWLVVAVLAVAGVEATTPVGPWVGLLMSPQVSGLALLIVAVVVAVVFALHRGAFEGGLLGALAAAAAVDLADLGGDQAVLVMAAAQLGLLFALVEDFYRLAYLDELTGLPGRRALNDSLRSLGGSYSLAMVDVDHFKAFNDRYGHDTGDQVLRMVGDVLRSPGGGGRAFRYGGEEFALVFGGRSVGDAAPLLEEVRAAVATRTFVIRSPERPRKKPRDPRRSASGTEKVCVTVSIGVAGSRSSGGRPEEVLAAADRALYRAKKDGRNRVVAG